MLYDANTTCCDNLAQPIIFNQKACLQFKSINMQEPGLKSHKTFINMLLQSYVIFGGLLWYSCFIIYKVKFPIQSFPFPIGHSALVCLQHGSQKLVPIMASFHWIDINVKAICVKH